MDLNGKAVDVFFRSARVRMHEVFFQALDEHDENNYLGFSGSFTIECWFTG